jgi:ribosome biogenesis ATPase
VIFFDELDSLVPKRGSDGNNSSERVVNQLLTELDGLEDRTGVFVIAATNRPDIIDPAMLRPGRLDKLLYVPLPTKDDRLSILLTCSKKLPISDNVQFKTIAYSEHCEGFSGADLSSLIREAQMSALKAAMDRNVTEEEKILIGQEDFKNALEKVFPSVSKKDEMSYARLENSLRKTRGSITNEDVSSKLKK